MTGAVDPGLAEPPCHIGIVVASLEDAMSRYSSLLGLEWAEPRQHTTVFRVPSSGDQVVSLDVVWSLRGPVHYELIEQQQGTIWGLQDAGALHHVGYWIESVVDGVHLFREKGFTLEATLPSDSLASGFAYLRSPEGLRLEIMDVRSKAMYDDYLGAGTLP